MRKAEKSQEETVKGGKRMTARELKHEVQLREWKERVAECRSSGKTVVQWCKEAGIATVTYYRWEREVLEKAGSELLIPDERENGEFVELSIVPTKLAVAEKQERVTARLRTRQGELEIYAGADVETLTAVLRAIKDAE